MRKASRIVRIPCTIHRASGEVEHGTMAHMEGKHIWSSMSNTFQLGTILGGFAIGDTIATQDGFASRLVGMQGNNVYTDEGHMVDGAFVAKYTTKIGRNAIE